MTRFEGCQAAGAGGHARIMAIVNRTPDGFYETGEAYPLANAIDRAMHFVAAGAEIIDVGGLTSGPGARVSTAEEIARVAPLVEGIRARSDVDVSVDTTRPPVARAALEAGATIINDISGASESDTLAAVADHDACYVAMHHAGPYPQDPFRPTFDDITGAVVAGLRRLITVAVRAGIPAKRVIVDPGYGFHMNTYQALELLRGLPDIVALGHETLVGVSRKDILGETLGGVAAEGRLEASLAAAVLAVERGATIVRVHDVEASIRAVRTAEAILGRRHPALAARGLE